MTSTTPQRIRFRKDTLAVRVYARHGDTCSCAPHCKTLGCASGYDSSDYVLSAQFAYLQEAIDYAQACARRGVNMRLVSRIVPTTPFIRDYAPTINPDVLAALGVQS